MAARNREAMVKAEEQQSPAGNKLVTNVYENVDESVVEAYKRTADGKALPKQV